MLFFSSSSADLKGLRPHSMQQASELKWEAALPYCCASGHSYRCVLSWKQSRQYIIWKERNVTMSKLFLRGIPSGVEAYQSCWAIGRGTCFDSHFLPCPWEAHIPYWPHRGQGHPPVLSQHSLLPSPFVHLLSWRLHCHQDHPLLRWEWKRNGIQSPNDHTKGRYSVNISVWD